MVGKGSMIDGISHCNSLSGSRVDVTTLAERNLAVVSSA